jgi:hypothetical protein
VLGDFKFHITQISKYFKDLGLFGAIKDGTATHSAGNHLD